MRGARLTTAAGHEVRLLQGSAEYFAAIVAAAGTATSEVWLETYIFDVTAGGATVAQALVDAAQRGVSVRLVVDGIGTGTLPPPWQQAFAKAGVQWHVFSPTLTAELLIPRHWRRLHRKLCLVDGHLLFCGGINVLDDFHDPNYGTLEAPRFDFAVQVAGPLVPKARVAMDQLWRQLAAMRHVKRGELKDAVKSMRKEAVEADSAAVAEPAPVSVLPGARAALLLRDNFRNRIAIERAYRRAIGLARHEVIIANAYFVPGRKLRNALVHAAKRGVKVRLLLQGRYEYFMQYHASRTVYGILLGAGVEIHEYEASFLHAKVAVVDGHWATVGSSNLDPLSLLLAREANVVVEDAGFAADLRTRLVAAIDSGMPLEADTYAHRPLVQRALDMVALGVLRIGLLLLGKRY